MREGRNALSTPGSKRTGVEVLHEGADYKNLFHQLIFLFTTSISASSFIRASGPASGTTSKLTVGCVLEYAKSF